MVCDPQVIPPAWNRTLGHFHVRSIRHCSYRTTMDRRRGLGRDYSAYQMMSVLGRGVAQIPHLNSSRLASTVTSVALSAPCQRVCRSTTCTDWCFAASNFVKICFNLRMPTAVVLSLHLHAKPPPKDCKTAKSSPLVSLMMPIQARASLGAVSLLRTWH
jgi:hypothetical protein